MSTSLFEHEYDPEELHVITPKGRDFQTLVAWRYFTHYVANSYERFTSDLLNYAPEDVLSLDAVAHLGH